MSLQPKSENHTLLWHSSLPKCLDACRLKFLLHYGTEQRQRTGKAQQAKHSRAKHRQSTAGKAQEGKAQAKHRQSTVGKSYLFQSSQTVAAEDCKKTLSCTAASQQSAFCRSCPRADPLHSTSSVESQCCRPSLIFFTP